MKTGKFEFGADKNDSETNDATAAPITTGWAKREPGGQPYSESDTPLNEGATMTECLEWYNKEAERILGGELWAEWNAMTDEQFESLIIEIKEETWASFSIEVIPPVFKNLALSVAAAHKSQDKIGVIALPLIAVMSASLGQGIRVQPQHFASYPNIYVYCSQPTKV